MLTTLLAPIGGDVSACLQAAAEASSLFAGFVDSVIKLAQQVECPFQSDRLELRFPACLGGVAT
jgi:hypothetical protein